MVRHKQITAYMHANMHAGDYPVRMRMAVANLISKMIRQRFKVKCMHASAYGRMLKHTQ